MKIDMQGMPYVEGDVVMVGYRFVDVARCLTSEEADTLNKGEDPWGMELSRVCRPKTKVHYYPDCQGREVADLSRSIRATTCSHCLFRRAQQLRGWRWKAAQNKDEVMVLKMRLGLLVADYHKEKST